MYVESTLSYGGNCLKTFSVWAFTFDFSTLNLCNCKFHIAERDGLICRKQKLKAVYCQAHISSQGVLLLRLLWKIQSHEVMLAVHTEVMLTSPLWVFTKM